MTTTVLTIFLQTQGGSAMMPVMLIGMIAVMYFFMIRPQQKRAKEQKKFADSMTTGDKIVTASGIHGRITRSNEDGTVVVEVDRNTNLTMERSAISMELTAAYRKKTNASTEVVNTK